MLPKDPILLLSFLNTKLRDCYSSLDSLCEDLNCNKAFIISEMKKIDYEYSVIHNQFK